MTHWDEFIERSTALFDGVADKSAIDDDLFVHQLAGFASTLDDVPKADVFVNAGLGPGIRVGAIDTGRRRGFFLLRWELDPGAVLPAHNHPNYSFCTICRQGDVNVQNFEIVGAAPAYDSATPFVVRKTQDQEVFGGRINTLTRNRDYIHELRAGPDGAVGMDIGILHTTDVGFSYLELEALEIGGDWCGRHPRDADDRVGTCNGG